MTASAELLQQAKGLMNALQFETAQKLFEKALESEPQSVEAYYYIGEAYRFKGDYSSSINAFQNALGVDPNFGPAYVGLARARLSIDPNTNVLSFLDDAIRLDPNFGEAYLGIRLGLDAGGFLKQNAWNILGIALGLVLVVAVVIKWAESRRQTEV